jgi:hypothetical protein
VALLVEDEEKQQRGSRRGDRSALRGRLEECQRNNVWRSAINSAPSGQMTLVIGYQPVRARSGPAGGQVQCEGGILAERYIWWIVG